MTNSDRIFADRITDVPRSFIREILKVALDPGVISFAGGLPNRELFPVEALKEATCKVFESRGRDVLQYASTEGFGELRESSLPITLLIEGSLFAVGARLYSRVTRPSDAVGRWGFAALVIFLAGTYAGSLFGPPPPNSAAVAWTGQLQWLLVLWGFWIDKHRQVAGDLAQYGSGPAAEREPESEPAGND